MSLLAPLYIAGLLAVGLPILFHLIRRTPQGKQIFSSLMFLTPSPPRITRRSRLDNLLLLLLRAAALCLLAFAFARPFLFSDAQADLSTEQGRRIAILMDVSASMQRGDLRDQAIRQVDQVLAELDPRDEAALYAFDQQVRPLMTFEEWNQTNPGQRSAMLRSRLDATPLTFAGTNLGSALATVADVLADARGTSANAADAAGRQIVLVTDLQQGSHAEALQATQWPANVALDVRRVEFAGKSNAALQVVRDTADVAAAEAAPLRVRITNQPDSTKDQFTLTWATSAGPVADAKPVSAYVPAGRSQIVRVPWLRDNPQADRLILSGDETDFDNTLYLVLPRTDTFRVVFIGDDPAGDPRGLRFYLEKVVVPTPQRKVEVKAHQADQPILLANLADVRLIVVTSALPESAAATLRQFAEQGGSLLWVLKDNAAFGGLPNVTRIDSLRSQDAESKDFALISRVNLEHPLFLAFADVRFSDFTKIHFWKHRQLSVDPSAPLKPLAWFDSGDPFVLEQPIGRGRLIVLTSGWQPADSQLALSTKFVPLIDGMLARRDGALVESQYSVADSIPLPPLQTGQTRSMTGPDGSAIEMLSAATIFDSALRPGIYRLKVDSTDIPLAVNVSPDESRTSPLAIEDLEQWGAQLGKKPVSDQAVARQQQLQIADMESRQKLWRWGILATLGLLVVETIVAGRLAHRVIEQPLEQQVTT